MSTKISKRGRGRPRQYDPDTALEAATRVFWQQGLAATTVDDITAATGMNKPSLYAAFGEKSSIYKACLARYNSKLSAELDNALNGGLGIKADLLSFYKVALKRYNTDDMSLGCFTFTTTQTSDLCDEMQQALVGLDALLEQRILKALDEEEIQAKHTPDVLVMLTSSLFLSLSLRVKSGQTDKTSTAAISACLDAIFDG